MRYANGNHLMYCLNIHPGETLSEVKEAIERHATRVQARICPSAPMALGLRLSRVAATELLPAVGDFRSFLRAHGFYVVSINGFPYGQFHGTRVKQDVYLPDWASAQRVAYTADLASILAQILPEGETGTISTVPCHYGKQLQPAAVDNLLSVADELANIERRTGRQILVTLEPEPDCLLDSQASTVDFFEALFQRCPSARQYLGVCLDCCHAAVAFESPVEWWRAFEAHGIAVPKIQISASLRVEIHPENRDLLRPFLDEQYLHQTRVACRGQTRRFADLPEAMAEAPDGEWRVHFHVPLHWSGGLTGSTVDTMSGEFFREVLSAGPRHLEAETYSFDVIPGDKPALVDSITSELRWLIERLRACQSSHEQIGSQPLRRV
jgi:sugar phosphate isomerase/epimerase